MSGAGELFLENASNLGKIRINLFLKQMNIENYVGRKNNGIKANSRMRIIDV